MHPTQPQSCLAKHVDKLYKPCWSLLSMFDERCAALDPYEHLAWPPLACGFRST